MSGGVTSEPLHVFIVAGEESGDQLGSGLMRALNERLDGAVRFSGVGGEAMATRGLASLFPLGDVALMGFVAVARRLPLVLARIRQTTRAIVTAHPNILVIVDSPDFTHRVARRVRAAAPQIPIVDYVSPSVWAWRPGRARAMRAYVDHVLALLPFEPAVHARLGGPPCTYVGHPLATRADELRPDEKEMQRRNADPPVLLVLPGSRRSEVRRLLDPFGAALAILRSRVGALEIIVPTVPHVAGEVTEAATKWNVVPRIVVHRDEKLAAFRIARAALAASGTVTLELALAGVPMVAAYRVAALEAAIARRVIKVPSVILANLVLGEKIVPEFLQESCTADRLAAALAPLLDETPERRRQTQAFARLDEIMQVGSALPDQRAADIVLALARKR
ncbi:MAG TPA: lipid-A-disaccharide synthase [Xanthobacteraceae bacterium]|nr:lipid-A-disaccharide synthase [Xanthobacteraceae bacterium]